MKEEQKEQSLEELSEESRAHIDRLNHEAWNSHNADPAASIAQAKKAERLAREAGYRRGIGWSMLVLGHAALGRGEHVDARTTLGEARGLLREAGDRRAEALALHELGIIECALGDYRRAVDLFGEGLEIARESGDRSAEANGLNSIGNIHYFLGEYPQALEHYHASLAIYQEAGNRSGEASALGNIGSMLLALGDYPHALEHYQAGLEITREIGNRVAEARALGNIGILHGDLGEYVQAREHYRASLEISREIGDRLDEMTNLTNIGNAHHLLGEHAEALVYHEGALEIARETGNRSGEAEVLLGIARAHAARGEFATALNDLQAGAEIAREIGSRSTLAQAAMARGQTCESMGDPERAAESFAEAVALASELGEKGVEREASELLARQYEKLGDSSAALAHLWRHMELQKEIFNDETRQTVQNLRSAARIELARKEAEIERLRNVELKRAFEELEQAHRDLKTAQAELVQAEKMASLGQLTAGIAHEINNPINFVSSSVRPIRRNVRALGQAIEEMAGALPSEESERIRSEYEIGENVEEIDMLLGSIEQGAARTAEIVASLRSFSRLDEGALKPVDLHEGLDAAVTILSGGAGDGVSFRREYGALPPVECYPGEINQVFMNILSNAVRAIDGPGSVTIRTGTIGREVTISIADSGVGMTPEIREKIFEPFFTTRDVGEGRGLGLSIAWGIVEKHGGTIEVESRPGEGSRFVVTLPLSAAGDSSATGG